MSKVGVIEIELDLTCGDCGGSLDYVDVGGGELRVQYCSDCYVPKVTLPEELED